MTRFDVGLIVASMFVVALLAGCASSGSSNVNSGANSANQTGSNSQKKGNDSAEELQALVPITFEPEEVTWRAFEAAGKQKLVAVLLLTADTHRQLSAKSGSATTDVVVNVEEWFPVELVTMGESSGQMTISGKAFPANEFYQAPYTSGNIVFIPETNYIILDLQSN